MQEYATFKDHLLTEKRHSFQSTLILTQKVIRGTTLQNRAHVRDIAENENQLILV